MQRRFRCVSLGKNTSICRSLRSDKVSPHLPPILGTLPLAQGNRSSQASTGGQLCRRRSCDPSRCSIDDAVGLRRCLCRLGDLQGQEPSRACQGNCAVCRSLRRPGKAGPGINQLGRGYGWVDDQRQHARWQDERQGMVKRRVARSDTSRLQRLYSRI